ncbi:MAG: hypothetical protein LBQ59_05575 [Candidatus Peribacteria bacterium]|nr:hypothetical protein [Candidatus Peribacteria bacterium]
MIQNQSNDFFYSVSPVILGSGLHPRLRENERVKLLLSLIRRGWERYGVRVVGNLFRIFNYI